VFSLLTRWQRKGVRSGAGTSGQRSCRLTFRPRFEALEDRCVPSTLTVNKADDDVTEKHTLRWAVANAVSGDEIQITAALKDTPIVLTQGELVLNQNVTIEGVGNVAETISGGGASRVFEVAAGTSVTIENVTITSGNGLANPSDTSNFLGDGGAILMHGTGTLTMSGCTLSGNSASRNGGAIYNDAGSVVLSGCTLSGNSAAGDGGAIVNTTGPEALFVSSFNNDVPTGQMPISQILRYDSNTGAPIGNGVFVPDGSAGLFAPKGLAFGPNGNLFVASSGSGQVLEYDGMTGAPFGTGVFIPAGSAGLSSPLGLVFGPNGNLFVSDVAGDKILEYDGRTGAPVGTGVFVPTGSAGMGAPYGLAFGPNGNLFVCDGNNRILEFDGTTGAPVGTGVFVPVGSAGMSIPLDLTFGPNGNLFVSSEGSLRVLEFDGTTGSPVGTGQFVPDNSAGLRAPFGLAFGPNGNLFVANDSAPQGGLPGYQVLEYDGTTGAPVGTGVFVSQESAGLSQPTFLVFSGGNSSSGTLSISDCTLTGNTATTGGGISNHGTLTVSDSTLTGNSSSADGGGIFNLGTLTISDSTLSGNSAGGNGGAIDNNGGGTAAVSQCVVANNSAGGNGGGIFNSGAGGAVTVSDSTFFGNTPDNIFGLFTDLGGNTFS
jgi:hypothetical protein